MARCHVVCKLMNSRTLCDDWERSLAGWAIPDEILNQTSTSPWRLRPENFAPSAQRANSPTVMKIRELLNRATEVESRSLMDVGCGAGGVSLAILDEVTSITAVDVSGEMLESFRRRYHEAGETRVTLKLVQGSWLSVAQESGRAGVVVCANVLYNVPNPCEFITRLNDAALIGVVIEIHDHHPHSVANPAWKHFWNIDRPEMPSAGQLIEIIKSLGINPETSSFYRGSEKTLTVDDDLVESIRQRICLDASRDPEVKEFLIENPVRQLESRLIWWTKQS